MRREGYDINHKRVERIWWLQVQSLPDVDQVIDHHEIPLFIFTQTIGNFTGFL
jgi:hypothetical protein